MYICKPLVVNTFIFCRDLIAINNKVLQQSIKNFYKELQCIRPIAFSPGEIMKLLTFVIINTYPIKKTSIERLFCARHLL
jgi:hypothetical protein